MFNKIDYKTTTTKPGKLPAIFDIPDSLKNSIEASTLRAFVNGGDHEGPAELLIMDEIGEDWLGNGVSAADVIAFLNDQADREVNVRINSPGGLVYDGLVIYNALANHSGTVTVTIEGLAFSAASFIAMAGDVVRMHEASDIGIHRALGFAMGHAKDARGLAEWLDTIDEHLVDIYSARTGNSRAKIEDWLDGTSDGTLFSAKDAVAFGFADVVIPAKKRAEEHAETAKANISRRIAAEHNARLRSLASRKTA